MKLKVRKAAVEDIQRICDFISSENPEAATRFIDAVDEEFSLLSAHPFLGRQRHFKIKGIRSWRVRGFEKYVIFYEVGAKALEVLRVLHGARDIRSILEE